MTDLVKFKVEVPGARDRWGVVFRPILVIPHAIMVGGPFVGLLGGAYRMGALGALAAVVAWAVKVELPVVHPAIVAMAVLTPYGLVFFGATALLRVPEATAVLRRWWR